MTTHSSPKANASPLTAFSEGEGTTRSPIPSEPAGLSLQRNFSWNLVGNIVYAGCQWGMVVVLTKLSSPMMVGRFALGLAVTAPIIMLSQLQLRGIQATDAKCEYEFGHYFGLRLLTTGLALFIIAGIVAWAGYPRETALVILMVGLSKSFEAVSDVCYGLMQRQERMDRIAKSRMLKGPLSLAALAIIVFLTGDVFWGVVGLTATWGLLMFSYDFRNTALTLREANTHTVPAINPILPIFRLSSLLRLGWLALPLGIAMALISLNTNIPRYFIENSWGEAELGIFAALAYLIIAGNTVVAAMGQSITPRLAKYFALGEIKKYNQLLLRMIGIGMGLGLCGLLVAIVAGRPILILLYRPEYADRAPVFVWLMIAGGISYVASFLGYGMTAARCFKAQLPLFITVSATIYGSALWLIPRFELTGAAFSLAIGSIVQILGSGLVLFYALGSRYQEGFLDDR